jgi:hypothetical protein
MNIIRTLILGAASLGVMAVATPAKAHDDRDHHHSHHWDHRDGGRVIINEQPAPVYGTVVDPNVTIAYGGHGYHHHHHHHHYHRDWR